MSAPKVALVRQKYNPAGGAERFVSRAMDELAKQGVAVTLITRQWHDASKRTVVELNPWYLGSTWRDEGFARAVCRHQKQVHYDLVQSHERLECCDVYRAGDGVHREWLEQRARNLDPLRRLAIHLNPHHGYLLRTERRMFESPRLRAVICNSRMVRDDIQRHFKIDESKLNIIYNGVDLDEFNPVRARELRKAARLKLGIASDVLAILHVGSGFERKGVAVLLRALALARGDGHLIVVGRDKHEARYRKLAAGLGIAERVHFSGPQSDPKSFYAAADAFATASLYEPFSNATVEALAMGLPVVTSSKSGAAEIIENGRTGYVCDALDVGGFAAAFQAFADRERRLAMGVAARAQAEKFSLADKTQELIELYSRLLAMPQSSAQ
ncbi:MAG: glycosyltransferase family 4 protein [Betaproteobacteria bacterium]